MVQQQTVVVHSGCQGYLPHSLAMGSLVILAACKGPVLYQVHLQISFISVYIVTF